MGRRVKCTQCPTMHCSTKCKMCPRCREVKRAAGLKNTQEAREAGLCLVCRKFEAEPEEARCGECKEALSKREKERKAAARERGDCSKCAKRPARQGKAYCRVCAVRSAKASARIRRKRVPVDEAIRLALRGTQGLSLVEIAEDASISTRTVLRVLPKMPDVQCVERVWNKKIYRRVA